MTQTERQQHKDVLFEILIGAIVCWLLLFWGTEARPLAIVYMRGIFSQTNRFALLYSTWFKVPIKNTKSESGAERLRLVSMHAGEVSGAVLNLFGTLSSL